MKLKSLMAIASSSALLVTSVTTIASCSSNTQSHIEGAETDVSIIGNNMVTYFQFVLNKALTDNQTLDVQHEDGGRFTFGKPTINGKLVSLPIYWLNTDVYEEKVWEGPITFTVKNGNETVWTQTIDGCKVTYKPYCVLSSDTQTITTELNDKTITAKFEFNIPTGMPKDLGSRLEAKFDVSDYENPFTIQESDVYFEFNDDKTVATMYVPAIKDATAVAEGDSFEFDVQIYCMYEQTDIPIWISNNYKDLKVSYSAVSNPIPIENLDIDYSHQEEPYYGYGILKGIKNLPPSSQYNTLLIPKDVIAVGTGTALELPNTVTKIQFSKDSVLTYFGENAFLDNQNISFIDVSAISNKAIGLETMSFGNNSFYGWKEKGTIVWGSDFSYYKRHMLMSDLYQAGLTYANWYNITEVDNESDLREACEMGANIKLTDNIRIAATEDYTGQIEIEKSLVLDLNGKTIMAEGPIYNYDAKDFAVFGIWSGAEVVFTDTSDNHNGCVKAYDMSNEGLAKTTKPTQQGPEYETSCWNWASDLNAWKPRESRCFYIRTDTPTKARTSLDILAGHYYGNCSTVFNWNGACWIEETFKDNDHKYAPEFHTLSPYADYDGKPCNTGAKELINCDDTKGRATGDAYFEVYGGKFFAVEKEGDPGQWHYYRPSQPAADAGQNWLANEEYRNLFEEVEISDVANPYLLVKHK